MIKLGEVVNHEDPLGELFRLTSENKIDEAFFRSALNFIVKKAAIMARAQL